MKFIYENYNKVEVSEGGWRGWARFNNTTAKELEKRSRKTRKQEKNKAIQIRRFGDVEVAPDAVRAHEGTYDNYSKRRVPPKVPGDNVKHQMRPKGMSAGEAARRKLAKVALGDKNRKLAKAYGIRDESVEKTIKKQQKARRDAINKYTRKGQLPPSGTIAKSMTEGDGITKKEKYMMKGRHLYNPKQGLQLEGIGAAYMPQAGKGKTAERELTSKAILKQLNRNRNKSTMKGKTEVPHIRYVNARDKSTDLIRPEKRKKRGGKRKVRKEGYNLVEKASPKMTQLLRMGLAKKGELHTMLRAIKRGPDAMKDPKLRSKMFELLNKLVDIIEKDGQIFVKVRQNVQRNRTDLQAVEEMLALEGVILGVNKSFEQLNITEDMSGMSVSSGHKRSVAQGAGMTKKGVAAYRRRNPGSKLKTAVTTPPSKLKPGSKAAKRRKAFCSRSRSWSSERGKAARRRWNC